MREELQRALEKSDERIMEKVLSGELIPESLDISIRATHLAYHKDRVEYFVKDSLTGEMTKIGERPWKMPRLCGGRANDEDT
jgi:hypothetical protein